MNRCGCTEEEVQQSQHSPGTVEDDEPLAFVVDVDFDELTFKSFPNGKLKAGTFSVCRTTHCSFQEMTNAVVGSETAPKITYKGYLWALARDIRAIVAKRNTSRDKTPDLTPKKAGAFCVIDDGEPDYIAHACLKYSKPTSSFWVLHETVAARGDLLIAFQARGPAQAPASPPLFDRGFRPTYPSAWAMRLSGSGGG